MALHIENQEEIEEEASKALGRIREAILRRGIPEAFAVLPPEDMVRVAVVMAWIVLSWRDRRANFPRLRREAVLLYVGVELGRLLVLSSPEPSDDAETAESAAFMHNAAVTAAATLGSLLSEPSYGFVADAIVDHICDALGEIVAQREQEEATQ